MKKLVFLGAMVLIVGGVALASSVVVPFFNDGGSLEPIPATGTASFIGVANMTDENIVCYVTYTSPAGLPMTPTNNTFLLPAKAGIGFRPVADANAEGVDGKAVPNVDMNAAGAKAWGSAVISWLDTATIDKNSVKGRLLQVNAASYADSAAYSLPSGE